MKTAEEIIENYDVAGLDSNDCDLYRSHDVIEAMEAYANQSKWVSVEDRLPEEGEYVLGLNNFNFIREVSWDDFTDQDHNWFISKFTHWQPLPERP